MFVLSSPWLQQGVLWELFKQGNSGQYSHMYVANYATWEVNTSISQEWLDQERKREPEMFAVEYGANFSQSLAAFLPSDLIDSSVNHNRNALPPIDKFKGSYFLSLDPAKGGRDGYVAVIVHNDGDRLVIDKWHEFSPSWSADDGKKVQVAISEVEDWVLLQHYLYGFRTIVLDQYNSQSSIQRLSGKLPIQELVWTAATKTQAFSSLRELFNGGTVELYPILLG